MEKSGENRQLKNGAKAPIFERKKIMNEMTKIWIYAKSPFKSDYANVLHFENEIEQNKFFEEPNKFIKLIYNSNSFQFVERNGAIIVKGRAEQFETATYMRFVNNGRIYYAFIYDILYQNENATQIIYEIDVWNTYQQELKKTTISGQIEQQTRKNLLNTIMDGQQGFQSGIKYTAKAGKVGIETEWLVIVAKPSLRLSVKQKKAEEMTYSGMQKVFKYFVVPIDQEQGRSRQFKYKGKLYTAFSLENLYKHLFGFKGESDTVNNIVNMYVTRDAGIKHTMETINGIPTINIVDNYLNGSVAEIGTERTAIYRPPTGTGSGTDAGDISTEENRVRLVTRLIKGILPDATANGIAGIIGNFSTESSVTAKRYECDWLTNYQYEKVAIEPTAENLVGSWSAFARFYDIPLNESGYLYEGKHYIGIGIGQWTGVRSRALWDFARSNNKDMWAFETQFQFMNTESKASTFQRIARSTASASDNALDFMRNWEGVTYNQAERVNNAHRWLPIIQNELSK